MAGLIVRMNEGDAAVDRGAAGLHAEFGYDIVLQSELVGHNEKLAGIQSGETLVIHGHGSTTKLGGLKATDLAKLLADSGLRGPVKILLYACKGGMTGAPFALELKVALLQGHKIMCSVMGAKGVLSRTRATGEWGVKNPDGSKVPMDDKSTYSTTCSF
jgi:hypothetical protein